MKFRPSLVPTVATAGALAILLNLGAWQIRRNGETAAKIADIHARYDGPPLTNATIDDPTPSYHTATLTGTFRSTPYLITGRGELGEVGFEVIERLDLTGGKSVLVNRGWIPRPDYPRWLGEMDVPSGESTVHGLVLAVDAFDVPATTAPIAAGDGLPERWPRDSYAAIASRVGDVLPIVIIAGDARGPDEETRSNERPPITGFHPEPPVRPHLQYAATWFLIAGTLIAIWTISSVDRRV